MSLNNAVNAAIAYIEGRTDIAKEIFRSPGSDVKNVSEVMARLDRAVNKTAARAIRNALKRSLAIHLDEQQVKGLLKNGDHRATIEAAFFQGVSLTEQLMDTVALELERA